MSRTSFKAPTYASETARIDAQIARLDAARWPVRVAKLNLERDAFELDRTTKGKPRSAAIRVHQLCDEAKIMMRSADVVIID